MLLVYVICTVLKAAFAAPPIDACFAGETVEDGLMQRGVRAQVVRL